MSAMASLITSLTIVYIPRSKKTSKLRVAGLCEGNSPVTSEFPTQRASNAEMFPFDDVIMHTSWQMDWGIIDIANVPRIMHTVCAIRCVAVVSQRYILSIFLMVIAQKLGESIATASEATLKNIGEFIPWIRKELIKLHPRTIAKHNGALHNWLICRQKMMMQHDLQQIVYNLLAQFWFNFLRQKFQISNSCCQLHDARSGLFASHRNFEYEKYLSHLGIPQKVMCEWRMECGGSFGSETAPHFISMTS